LRWLTAPKERPKRKGEDPNREKKKTTTTTTQQETGKKKGQEIGKKPKKAYSAQSLLSVTSVNHLDN
jgi:hypothetical protein